MKLLFRCTALLVAALATSPAIVSAIDFSETNRSSDTLPGSVIPEDAKAALFVNQAPRDILSSDLKSPTPTPYPTSLTPVATGVDSSAGGSWAGDNETREWTQQSEHIQYAIRSGKVPSRGVNLGSWLVTENWMTADADVWKGLSPAQASAGEQTAFRNTPRDDAVSRFKWHRDNFITENEIAKIAKAGLNTVRVPVGYWIVGFDKHDFSGKKQWENYAPGGLEYLDRLIRVWAKKYNIAVLISMHAAKGSQNGADHSSPEEKDKSYWSSYWENLASTLDSVVFLADRYKNDAAFLGIGLLNEPGGTTSNTQLYKYYEDAYKLIRQDGGNDCILTIAPLLWEQSADFMTQLLPGATNVWVEWHRYFVWGYENASEEDLLNKYMTKFQDDVNAWKQKSDKKMFIGEFSFATAGKFQDQQRLKEFGQKQMDVMFNTVDGGWTFWSWRIYGDENGVNPWSLRSLIRNGLFPAMPTN